MLNLNIKYLDKKINTKQIFDRYKLQVEKNHNSIYAKKVDGSEMLGWLNYPNNITNSLISDIESYANNFRSKKINNILFISIGGSYTALRAAIDFCTPMFKKEINVYYAHTLSTKYLNDLKKLLEKEDFFIIVISKSGSTLEPAISLRLFYEVLLKKYGSINAQQRIVAITSEKSGSLIKVAKKNNWKCFYIPDDIGGRFSSLTPITLLPLAMMGVDIKKVINGAKKAEKDTNNKSISKNTAYKYAVLRNHMYLNQKKKIEVFGSYHEDAFYFLEHLKQLFGESEGKNKKGLFPVISRYTADLHSMGQFYQDGSPIFFETLLVAKREDSSLKIKKLFDNIDDLNKYAKFSIDQINSIAAQSVMEAHLEDGNQTIEIVVDKFNEESFGYLYYWFSKAVTMSALLLKLNPFDQPGVESYKKKLKQNLKKK